MLICFTYWIIIFSTYHKQAVCSMKNEYYYSIVDGLIRDLKPYQSIYVLNNRSDLQHAFYRKMAQRISALSIDLFKLDAINDNRSLSLPILQYPTVSTLYVFFETQDKNSIYVKSFQNSLDRITQLSPISSRPRCLLVINAENFLPQRDVDDMLSFAWSLKYLDFSILVLSSHDMTTTFNYNPFSKQIYRRIVTPRTKLFPLKMKNFHGYTIKVPAIELPPYLLLERDGDGNVTSIEGMSFRYCQILSQVLNFSVEFVTGAENSVLQADFKVIFEQLHTGEIDMLTLPFNVRSIMYEYRDWVLMGKLFLDTNYVFVVPVLPLLKIDIPLDVVICIPLLFVIIIIYYSFTRRLHFSRRHWQINKIFQILLGVTVMRDPPRKLVERIVYFSLIVLSMKYSIETMSKIMDIKLLKGEVGFDSLAEIADSSLPIYTLEFIIDHVYVDYHNDETLEKLKMKTEAVADIFQCIYQIQGSKSCICVTPHSAGAYASKQFINADGSPNMKVARPLLYKDMAAFGFERTSPFVRRFDEIIQRIVESGISDVWTTVQQYTVNQADFEQRKPIRENIFLLQLCGILSLGYATAVVAFGAEIARKRGRDRRRTRAAGKALG